MSVQSSTPVIFRRTRLRIRLWAKRMRFALTTSPQRERALTCLPSGKATIRGGPRERTLVPKCVSFQLPTLPIQALQGVATTFPPRVR